MTELDEVLPGEAFDVIEEYGATMTLVRKVKGAYDPATSSQPLVDDEKIVKCVIDDATQGKRKFYIAAMAVDFVNPTSVDRVESDGKSYGTFEVETIKSGELDCLYIVSVAR